MTNQYEDLNNDLAKAEAMKQRLREAGVGVTGISYVGLSDTYTITTQDHIQDFQGTEAEVLAKYGITH